MSDQESNAGSDLGGLLGQLRKAARWLGGKWQPFHDGLLVLRPAWLAALVSISIAVALQVPQARDSLNSVDLWSWSQWTLLFAAVIMAASAWYFSRALLYVRYPFTPSRPTEEEADRRFEPLRRYGPRVLGALPLLSLVVAGALEKEWRLAVLYLVVTAMGLYAVWARRKRLSEGDGRMAGLVDELPPATYRWVLRFMILAAGMLALFMLVKVRLPQLAGPLGILFAAAAVWIAIGSMVLIYPTHRFTVPSLVIMAIVAAGLFSLFNDNHQIRLLDDQDGGSWQRDTAAGYFHEWLDSRSEGWTARVGAGREFPVVIVAAEGGGIRAGYWTAAVLAVLEEKIPGFACHVFAISGVSGGSLGAAVYTAQIADRLDNEPGYVCDGRAVSASGGAFLEEATSVLDDDFLAPALAGLLFPDLLQRFLPLPQPLALPDRAVYLETAWEDGWKRRERHDSEDSGPGRFAESLRQLWQSHERHDPSRPANESVAGEPPSLFLNGSWVEDGGRNVTSNLSVTDDKHFVELDDVLSRLEQPIRLSTAVHNSARFTYVSPAGTIGTGAETRRIVDGGYFEVSGGATGAEIVRMIRDECPEPEQEAEAATGEEGASPTAAEAAEEHACGLEVNVLAVYIRNSREKSSNGQARSLVPLSETLSPVKAIFKSRNARARVAVVDFEQSVAGRGSYHYVPLTGMAPLGWTLSSEVRGEMDARAEEHPAIAQLVEAFDRARKPAAGQ